MTTWTDDPFDIFGEAATKAPLEASPRRLRGRARRAGLPPIPEPTQRAFLTRSQRNASDFIVRAHEAKRRCHELSGFRAQPLLAGLSGSGKTHAVGEAAQRLGIPLLSLSVGTWIPLGAREKASLVVLREALQACPALVILIDEIEKADQSVSFGSAWSVGVTTEIFFLLDASEQLIRSAGFTSANLLSLRSSCLTVGAGAWQLALRKRTASVGFRTSEPASLAQTVEDSRQLPEETLFRFSDLLAIEPPSVPELAHGIAIARYNLRLPPLPPQERIAEARRISTGRGIRDLERYTRELVFAHPDAVPRPPFRRRAAVIPGVATIDGEGLRATRQSLYTQAQEFVKVVHRLALTGMTTSEGREAVRQSLRLAAASRDLLLTGRKPSAEIRDVLRHLSSWLKAIGPIKGSMEGRNVLPDAISLEEILRIGLLAEIGESAVF